MTVSRSTRHTGPPKAPESWVETVPRADWPGSGSWDEAAERLRRLMDQWIHEAVGRQGSREWGGGHDEGAFVASWPAHALLSGDPAIGEFIKQLRGQFRQWADRELFHGYWAEKDVHHGTENHLYFLPRVWAMAPEQTAAAQMLEDLAEHLGNWVKDVPAWYDWEHHVLVSSWPGTRRLQTKSPHDLNVPDCWRLVTIALATFRATGVARYLEWAVDYADHWAGEILQADGGMPVALHGTLDRGGAEQAFARLCEEDYRLGPSGTDLPLARLESYVCHGVVDGLLDLWRLTGTERFLEAAERVLADLVPTLADPYALASGALLAKYRRWTGRDRFDQAVLEQVGPPEFGEVMSAFMEIYPDWQACELLGIGHRNDAPFLECKMADGWLSRAVGASPAALGLAYTITGQEAYLVRALDTATVRLQIAMEIFKDGRHHACGAQSISAVVRGHGRENNYGNVTATLYPAALGAYDFAGSADPEVRLRHQFDRQWQPGLPPEVAVLLRPAGDDTVQLTAVNRGAEAVQIEATPLRVPDGQAQRLTLAPQEGQTIDLPSRTALGPSDTPDTTSESHDVR